MRAAIATSRTARRPTSTPVSRSNSLAPWRPSSSRYVVVTSVDRDDLADFGAGAFAATISAIRTARPECRVEVLIPDFQGNERSLRVVLDAGPDVLNHNVETVPRLYRLARPGGRYPRALELLDRARRWAPGIPTKTGLMVGLGETLEEIVEVLADLRKASTAESSRSGSTCGRQSPTCRWSATTRPTSFESSSESRWHLGFGHVESGPLVRSSYHAHEQADSYVRGFEGSKVPGFEGSTAIEPSNLIVDPGV